MIGTVGVSLFRSNRVASSSHMTHIIKTFHFSTIKPPKTKKVIIHQISQILEKNTSSLTIILFNDI